MSTATIWEKGVGRIERKFYRLKIGGEFIDVDECRSAAPMSKLKPALTKLDPPITAEEAVWLANFIVQCCAAQGAHSHDQMLALLEVVQRPFQPKVVIMDVATEVREILSADTHVPLEQLTDGVTLKELGLDSLDIIEVMFSFEGMFAITIDDGEITENSTIASIIALCERRKDAA